MTFRCKASIFTTRIINFRVWYTTNTQENHQYSMHLNPCKLFVVRNTTYNIGQVEWMERSLQCPLFAQLFMTHNIKLHDDIKDTQIWSDLATLIVNLPAFLTITDSSVGRVVGNSPKSPGFNSHPQLLFFLLSKISSAKKVW